MSANELAGLRAIAATQLALFTRAQATEAAVFRDRLRSQVACGVLERAYPDVFGIAGVPWSPERRHLAAVLAGGDWALATHRAGAWAWGLTRHPQRPEISIPYNRCVRLPGVRVHRSSDLPTDPVKRRAIPTTSVERVLVDLGAVLRRGCVRDGLDRAIANRDTTPMRVRAELERLAQHGRRGVGPMRALLEDAGVTGSHPPSVLEAKTRRLIQRAGLPQPECELVAGENGEYRLDFCWPELQLTVEVHGWQYHSSYDAFYRGLTRQNALVLTGLAILEYSWRHITTEQAHVTSELRAAYRARTALLG